MATTIAGSLTGVDAQGRTLTHTQMSRYFVWFPSCGGQHPAFKALIFGGLFFLRAPVPWSSYGSGVEQSEAITPHTAMRMVWVG